MTWWFQSIGLALAVLAIGLALDAGRRARRARRKAQQVADDLGALDWDIRG